MPDRRSSLGAFPGRALYLIPWHIGNWADLTLRSVAIARKLRVFLVEEVEDARSQFRMALRLDPAEKEFWAIPVRPQPRFADKVLALLRREDVGVASSGGSPCFGDPGGWLIGRLRERGVRIVALPGASSLTTLLCQSGFDWVQRPESQSFSFVFFKEGDYHEDFREIVRRSEPVVVFLLSLGSFERCLRTMEPLVGERPISAFFDMTKPASKFPYADHVRTMTCRQWLQERARIRWERISDVALLLHPGRSRR